MKLERMTFEEACKEVKTLSRRSARDVLRMSTILKYLKDGKKYGKYSSFEKMVNEEFPFKLRAALYMVQLVESQLEYEISDEEMITLIERNGWRRVQETLRTKTLGVELDEPVILTVLVPKHDLPWVERLLSKYDYVKLKGRRDNVSASVLGALRDLQKHDRAA